MFVSQAAISSENDVTDDDFFSDIPMVISVSRLEQPRSEAPASVTIIDREMIQASGLRELADVLGLVPGFIVGHIYGNQPVVTYQGLGYNFNRQLQVLINGRSVYIPTFGGIPWESLPVILEDIEKIEITRGPNAASYGSNSFLSVINIITKEAIQDTGTQISLTRSNDKDILDGYVSYSKQSSDYDWRFSAKTQRDNGFDSFDSQNINHDSKNIQKFNVSSNFFIEENSQWALQFGQNDGDLDIGRLNSPGDIVRQKKTTNRFIQLNHEQSSSHSSTRIQLTHTQHNVKDFYNALYTFNGVITPAEISYDRKSERNELEIQTTLDWSEHLRLVFGGSVRKDTVDSFFFLGNEQKQNILVNRLFAHSEYKLDSNNIINIGGMLEESDAADFEVSPRIAFIHHINKQHSLRFSYSKAFRNPILFELYGRFAFLLTNPILSAFSPVEFYLPNPDLKPEEINSFEIGLYSRLNSKLETDLKLYQYRLSNQIDFLKVGSKIQHVNITTETEAKGLEGSISYKHSPSFFIKAGFNAIQAQSELIELENSFPNTTSFILSQYDINSSHSVSGTFYYSDNFNWTSYSEHKLRTTNRLDLRYAHHFFIENTIPVTLDIVGQDLIHDNLDYLDTNLRTPSIYLKLSSHF